MPTTTDIFFSVNFATSLLPFQGHGQQLLKNALVWKESWQLLTPGRIGTKSFPSQTKLIGLVTTLFVSCINVKFSFNLISILTLCRVIEVVKFQIEKKVNKRTRNIKIFVANLFVGYRSCCLPQPLSSLSIRKQETVNLLTQCINMQILDDCYNVTLAYEGIN